MSRYKALVQERADLVAEGKRIFEAAEKECRELTDAEKGRDDAINARLEAINPELGREEARRERERTVAPMSDAPRYGDFHDRAVDRPWGHSTFNATLEEFVAAHPTALPVNHPQHPRSLYVQAGAGEFLQGVHRAFTGQGTDPRLLYQAAAQGAGEFVGADGGFLVPREQGDDIILRLFGGEVLSRVRRRTLTVGNSIEINVVDETSRAAGSRHGAVQGYRLDEGTGPTASRPKFAKLEWKPRRYAALGYATDELLADASLLAQVILDAFVDELQFMAEDDVINGTGTGMPQGMLVANCRVSVAKETGQAATTFLYENALKMWSRLNARHRRNAVWYVNQDVEPQLYSMALVVGTGGVPVFLPAGGASGAPYSTLFGRPVVPIEYAATLGTVGDVILCDPFEYWFFDRGEPSRATSLHVAFTTSEQAFRVVYRADGKCRWIAPLTPYKGSNTQSCCVTVDTRS